MLHPIFALYPKGSTYMAVNNDGWRGVGHIVDDGSYILGYLVSEELHSSTRGRLIFSTFCRNSTSYLQERNYTVVRKDDLEFDFSVSFLMEEERISPKDADFSTTSPRTRYEPYWVGKSGININVE